MQRAGFWAGIAVGLLILLLPIGGADDVVARRTAAVAALMAIWWLTEAVAIAVTALLPLVLFPALGILTPTEAAAPYANPVIFLFLGGFMLALAMQRWGLHRRIAMGIVAATGSRPDRLVLGFMLATAFISMWISNTATAAMMVPIGIAICDLLRPRDRNAPFPFGTALMLGIAYAATIGGITTLIGTPPNAVFAAAASEQLGRPIGFAAWMMVGVPVAAVLLPVVWLLLVRVMFRVGTQPTGADALLAEERTRLGTMTRPERITTTVFALMALAWILRDPKDFGAFTVPGIATFAPRIDDATISIAGALLLFLIPSGQGRSGVLEWEDTKTLPWGVLLIFGGGLSLARAFETSGLAQGLAQIVGALGAAPVWLMVMVAVALFIALSELASNTAVAAMAMPILAATALGIGVPPVPLMAAGALAASCSFMLPVGTPPNAIVFGTGYVTIRQMAITGFFINLIALMLVTLAAVFLAPLLD